jgi:16S rRNA G527 N7-methylase RsmG
LVKRVRSLEEKRLEEVKEYATKLEAMSRQQMTVFSRAVCAIQDITKIVNGWMNRPCQVRDEHGKPLTPTPLPEVDTEVLLRNEDKVKKHKQDEHSAA